MYTGRPVPGGLARDDVAAPLARFAAFGATAVLAAAASAFALFYSRDSGAIDDVFAIVSLVGSLGALLYASADLLKTMQSIAAGQVAVAELRKAAEVIGDEDFRSSTRFGQSAKVLRMVLGREPQDDDEGDDVKDAVLVFRALDQADVLVTKLISSGCFCTAHALRTAALEVQALVVTPETWRR